MYIKRMTKQLIAILLVSSILAISLIFNFTTPADIHPIGILVLFAALFVLAFVVLVFLLFLIDRTTKWTLQRFFARNVKYLPGRKIYLYASALALAPIILLAIRSIGEGNAYGIILVILFEVIACFYISKMS